jgi:hypothetical protein
MSIKAIFFIIFASTCFTNSSFAPQNQAQEEFPLYKVAPTAISLGISSILLALPYCFQEDFQDSFLNSEPAKRYGILSSAALSYYLYNMNKRSDLFHVAFLAALGFLSFLNNQNCVEFNGENLKHKDISYDLTLFNFYMHFTFSACETIRLFITSSINEHIN